MDAGTGGKGGITEDRQAELAGEEKGVSITIKPAVGWHPSFSGMDYYRNRDSHSIQGDLKGRDSNCIFLQLMGQNKSLRERLKKGPTRESSWRRVSSREPRAKTIEINS